MDAVDRQLIQALRENGRASYAELGRLVGLSGPSVTDRINRLEAAGVITGYRATVDAASLGLGVTALIGISALRRRRPRGRGAPAAGPATRSRTAGSSRATTRTCSRCGSATWTAWSSTIRRLSGTKGVSRTRTTIVLSTKWENRVGELPEEA